MTKTSPRRRRWPLVLAVCLLGLLLGLRTFLTSDAFGRWLADLVELAAGELLGEDVVIGDLELAPLARRARVSGLVISRASEPGQGEIIAAVDAMEVQLGLRDGTPVARTVRLVRPVVRLNVGPEGLREFPGLQSGGDGPADSFPWQALWIEEADVRVTGPEWSVHLDDVEVGPTASPDVVRLDPGDLDLRFGELERQFASPGVLELGLTPRGVELPPLVLDGGDLRVEGRGSVISGEGTEGTVSVRADPSLLRELTKDEFRPLSPVHADVELVAKPEGTEVTGAVYWPELQVEVGGREPFRVLSLGTLSGPLSWDGRAVHFDGVRLEWAGGDLVLDGQLDPLSTGLYVSVRAEEIQLEDALVSTQVSPTPWVTLSGDLELHIAGTLAPLRLEGSHEIVIRDLVARDGPAQEGSSGVILALPRAWAEGTLSVTPEAVRVGVAPLRTPRSVARGRALLRLAPDAPLDIDLRFSRLDLRELAPLGGMELGGTGVVDIRLSGPPSALAAEGQARIEDFVIFGLPIADRLEGPFRSPDLRRLQFPDTKATLGVSRYAGEVEVVFEEEGPTVDLAVILSEGRLAEFTGIFFDLPQVDSMMEGELALSGPPDALDGEVNLRFRDSEVFGEAFDGGRAVAWMDQGLFTLEELSLERREGRESVLARGTVGKGWRTDMELLAEGFRLEDLANVEQVELSMRGDLSLDARIGGTLFEPSPEGRLTLRNTVVGPGRIGDSTLSFRTEDRRLVGSGVIAGKGLRALGSLEMEGDQSFEVRATLADFPLEGLYPEGADGSPIEARLSGEARITGDFGDEPSPVGVTLDGGGLRLAWAGHVLETPKAFHYEQLGDTFGLQDFVLQGGQTDLSFGGKRTDDGRVLFAGGGTVDLDLLRAVTTTVEEVVGTAEVNISVGGPVGDVEPVIDVAIDGARVGTDWLPENFEEVVARLTLRPDSVVVRQARGRLGGGTWALEGRLDAEEWVPTRSELAFELRDGRVEILDFLPRTTGSAELQLDGPLDDLLLSGAVEIADMTFAERIDWEEWVLAISGDHLEGAVSEERGDYFSMDIDLSAKDTIRVRNNVGDLVASAELQLSGDTQRPGLTGDVRVRPGGSAYLKEREFEIVRGELRFMEPYAYDPELDIAMETQISARDQDYRIETQVMGPYSDWRVATSANPNLPEADINALLLFGMTREELERYGLEGALAMETADLIASSLGLTEGLASLGGGIFGSEVGGEDLIRIDRIDLVSGISSRGSNAISSELRLLIEGQLPWWQGTTLAAEQNLFRGSDRTVTVEKRVAESLYVSGFWAQEQEGRYLPIGGAYGLDLGVRWELD